MRRPIIIGNWKMNGDRDSNERLLKELVATWRQENTVDVVICPSFPYLDQAARELSGTPLLLGAQDVSSKDVGAFTGDVSAAMLADMDCCYAIVGHSERRHNQAESDELVAQKALRVLEKRLTPVICVGETQQQREAEQTLAVIDKQLQPHLARLTQEQLQRSVIAYEPRWAIGTGKTASPAQAQEIHAYIREQLGGAAPKVRILYGGSVKPENAEALFAQSDIDGALVGGASLQANDFLAICRAAANSGIREV